MAFGDSLFNLMTNLLQLTLRCNNGKTFHPLHTPLQVSECIAFVPWVRMHGTDGDAHTGPMMMFTEVCVDRSWPAASEALTDADFAFSSEESCGSH